ncbi:MAG TPA: UDP-N-acetylmuramoyl-L-alanine--D-glutamate ligase [Solirubrobacteraceae bacterium]
MKQRPPIPAGPYLIVGLARSGSAAAHALRARGEQVIGLDSSAPAAGPALRRDGVELFLNADDVPGLLDRVRAVVKSPGVPASADVIVAARARGLAVLGELELAWRMLPNEFVAVTGTNGKTTTVELIGHIHRQSGLAVAVAGNVGTAASSLVGTLDHAATIVCEASSFQLQDTLELAPEAAVLLNITPDHLDRHGTLEAYAAAKLEIFARQGGDDVAVLAADLERTIGRAGGEGPGATIGGAARRVRFGWDASAALFELDGELWWQDRPLVALSQLRLRGRHNVENAMAAAAVCLARGLAAQDVSAGLASFEGVANRLEEVATIDGVLYVNDSKATNVASTLVALDAFAGQAVHLIAGGQGKGQDFAGLRGAVERTCAGVYLIGEHAPTIATALANVGPPVLECGDLEHALAAARRSAGGDPDSIADGVRNGERGPVVLLSPACASFDQFADFEARGGRFRELVREMEA